LGIDQTSDDDGEGKIGDPEEVEKVASLFLVRSSKSQEKSDDGDFGKSDTKDSDAGRGPEVLESDWEVFGDVE